MATTWQLGRSRTELPNETDLFDLLSHQRRRYTIHALKQRNASANLGELAEQIAAWENETPPQKVSCAQRKRVYTALQQQHLPRMDKQGLIEFDQDRGVVKPRSELEEIEVYLDVVHGKEIPWSEYYLGVSGIIATLASLVYLGVWPVNLLHLKGWLVFIVVVFGVSALVHHYFATGMRLGSDGRPPEANR